MKTKQLLLLAVLFLMSKFSSATIYYVATTGSDANSGTIGSPFLTIQRAQTSVVAGDTVYVRGGTYAMQESQIATYSSIWAYVTYLTKSGTTNKRINYWNYPGEKPIFNYTAINPAGYRITAFQVNASWLHIKGLEVIGVQVNITTHTQSECFENQGSNNIYEQLTMHDGKAIGFYLTKGGNNLILNCDAYNNWDNISETGTGGNVDGFGFHANNDNVGYTNNIFRGCRAWFNSDDGFDCINAFESVKFESCWAFYNGYSTSFASLGDGNGFKAGGYGVSTTPTVPDVIPRNTIVNCLAVRNKANGFYANHHLGGNDWFNNSAYFNATNYNMLNRNSTYTADASGYGHVMKNNLGWGARSTEYSNIDFALCNADTNYFNLAVTINSSDFLSTDQALLTSARQADGSLPNVNFMKLVAASDAIDKGRDIGLAFYGWSPDLGCFESNYGIVPVQLNTFFATVKNNNTIILIWQASNEINNKGWDIERCELTNNNSTNWKKIGFISSSQKIKYEFEDANLNQGIYGYRLKQIDNDGQYTYSYILTINIVAKNKTGLMVYPNPINNQSVLQYHLLDDGMVKINLYNPTGALVNTLVNEFQTKGLQQIKLDKHLFSANGSYLIELQNSHSKKAVWVIK